VLLPKAHWLHTAGYLALGEWSHHCGYLGHEHRFCVVFRCILATCSVLYCAIFAWNVPLVSLIFLSRSLVFSILLFSSISLHQSLSKDLYGSKSYSSLYCWQFSSWNPHLSWFLWFHFFMCLSFSFNVTVLIFLIFFFSPLSSLGSVKSCLYNMSLLISLFNTIKIFLSVNCHIYQI